MMRFDHRVGPYPYILLLLLVFLGLGQLVDRRRITLEAFADEGSQMKKAYFGGGCFWGVEEAFRAIPGVTQTVVGFMGGGVKNPSYVEVCGGSTGHAEVVEVTYDPHRVPYEVLLSVFWSIHDPTQVNRQGPDIGSQYRSVIFCVDEDQHRAAQISKGRLDAGGKYLRPIATEIEYAATFYRAEEYHQRYLQKLGRAACGAG